METLNHLYQTARQYAHINPSTSRTCLGTFFELARRLNIEIDREIEDGFCPACFSFYDSKEVLRVRGKRRRRGTCARKMSKGEDEKNEAYEEHGIAVLKEPKREKKSVSSCNEHKGGGKGVQRRELQDKDAHIESSDTADLPSKSVPKHSNFAFAFTRQVHYRGRPGNSGPLHLNKQCGTCGAVVRLPLCTSPPKIPQPPQLVSVCDDQPITSSAKRKKLKEEESHKHDVVMHVAECGGKMADGKSRLGSTVWSAGDRATPTRPSPSHQGKGKQQQQQNSVSKKKKMAGDIARMLKGKQAQPATGTAFSLDDFLSSL